MINSLTKLRTNLVMKGLSADTQHTVDGLDDDGEVESALNDGALVIHDGGNVGQTFLPIRCSELHLVVKRNRI